LAGSIAAMFLDLHLPPNQGRGDAQGRSMATDETEEDPKLPPDARLNSLEERLERAQAVEAKRTHKAQPNPGDRVWGLMFSHLVGAPVGGAVVGWGLDSLAALFGYRTFPLLTIVTLFLGFGAGVMNVLRISKTQPGGTPGNRSQEG
jgi:ATP synthase protein I